MALWHVAARHTAINGCREAHDLLGLDIAGNNHHGIVGRIMMLIELARVADIAHAVHGAIGVTEEFDLQLYTRRLREWRLAAGSESYWHERIGAEALADGADAVSYLRCALFDRQAA